MASNLLKYVQQTDALLVYNRTEAKAANLIQQGARFATLQEMATHCNIVFSMLFDDEALKTTFDSIASCKINISDSHLGFNQLLVACRDLIYVDCSTVYPETTKQLTAKAETMGIQYVACTVFGRPDAARNKSLVAALAGNPAATETVRPYITSMTRTILDVGIEPYLANVQKLTGNFLIAGVIELLAEAQALAEKNGLSRQQYSNFVCQCFPAPIITGYSNRIASQSFEIKENEGFPVRGGIKDVSSIKK